MRQHGKQHGMQQPWRCGRTERPGSIVSRKSTSPSVIELLDGSLGGTGAFFAAAKKVVACRLSRARCFSNEPLSSPSPSATASAVPVRSCERFRAKVKSCDRRFFGHADCSEIRELEEKWRESRLIRSSLTVVGTLAGSPRQSAEKHAERSDSPLPLADDDALPRLLGLGAAARAAAPGAADMKGAPQPKLCKTQRPASLLHASMQPTPHDHETL